MESKKNAVPSGDSSKKEIDPQVDAGASVETEMIARPYHESTTFQRHPSFEEIAEEVTSLSTYETLTERDLEADCTFSDWLRYRYESIVTAEPRMRYVFLILFSFSLVVFLSAWWVLIPHPENHPMDETLTFRGAVYLTINVLTTGDYNGDVVKANERICYFMMIAAGLLVVAVLIGIVTDSVTRAMYEQVNGRTKVVESEHTLILGWNDSTTRLVCQIAFLRRVFLQLNETWPRRLFPWLRVLPSSPVAKNKVVLMSNQKTKKEMEFILSRAFSEAHVQQFRTAIGRDVIIREGDPTSTHDLLRVSAQRATSVCLMMTAVDEEESEYSNGRISNSASIRCLLALRSLVLSNGVDPKESFNEDLRVVVQLQQTCPFVRSASFVNPGGVPCVYPMDLSKIMNTIMFQSASKPGLTRVLSDLLDFEDCAIRCRPAKQMSGGRHNELGFFVGKTARTATLEARWKSAVLIGVESGSRAPSLYRKGRGAILCEPDRLILADDWLIFAGRTSNPQRTNDAPCLADFKKQAQALMAAADFADDAAAAAALAASAGFGDRDVGSSAATAAAVAAAAGGSVKHQGLALAADDNGAGVGNVGKQPSVVDKAGKEEVAVLRPTVGRARRLSATDYGQLSALPSAHQHVLVMGWRPEWNMTPAAFRGRLRDICDGLPLGSTVTCLNVLSPQDFDEHLCRTGTHSSSNSSSSSVASTNAPSALRNRLLASQQGQQQRQEKRKIAWPVAPEDAALGLFDQGWEVRETSGERTFKVMHHCGDPVHFNSVSSLLRSPSAPLFDTAICLGNVVGAKLSADARDSRVLSMFLILRQITEQDPKWNGRSIHIISENQLDQTTHLALVPKRIGLSSNPLVDDQAGGGQDETNSSTKQQGQGEADRLAWAFVHDWSSELEILPSPDLPQTTIKILGRKSVQQNVYKAVATLTPKALEKGKGASASSSSVGSSVFLRAGEKFRFEASKIVADEGATAVVFYKLSGKGGAPSPGWVNDRCPKHPGRRAIQVLASTGEAFKGTPEPDLMNSNMVIGGAMALTLAYPQIKASVMELISTSPGTPEIEFYPPGALGITTTMATTLTGGEPQRVAFGVIQHVLDVLYGGYAACLGYMLADDGHIVLTPPASTRLAWQPADRIIVLIRHAERPNNNNSKNWTTTATSKDGGGGGDGGAGGMSAAMKAWGSVLDEIMTEGVTMRKAPPSLEVTQAKVEANAKQTGELLQEVAGLKRMLESLGAKDPTAGGSGGASDNKPAVISGTKV